VLHLRYIDGKNFWAQTHIRLGLGPKTTIKLGRFNPFFYIIDGFRYGFFSQSDFNPWVSLSVVTISGVAAAAFATYLLQVGYKIRK
jgi:ABC-type polysaccharide/polyol phosphate export permease